MTSDSKNKTALMNAVFNNPFQVAASEYKAEFLDNRKISKPVYLAPEIVGEYEENEETWYKLANGNTILKEKYIAMWRPVKTPVLPLHHKGDNPDKTKIP